MNRLLCQVLKNKTSLYKSLYQNVLPNRLSTTTKQNLKLKSDQNQDTFGIGSKYAKLDTASVNRKVKKISDSKKIDEEYFGDPDQFGTLGNANDTSKQMDTLNHKDYEENELEEEKYDKILNHIRLKNNSEENENTENFYASRMRKLAKEGKIKEAIDIFFIEMIEKDRYKPTLWLYKVMIDILADVGYTHMAFALFKRILSSQDDDWLKKSSSKHLEKIISLLFLACSKSVQWPEYSIKKIDYIRLYMKKKDLKLNKLNYAAMISAYGKAGAIYEAFNAVDEMNANGIKTDIHIINNLLCCCISQPENGFHQAIKVWQACLSSKVKPNLFTFNLLLRSIRDCNINKKPTAKSNLDFKNLMLPSKQLEYSQKLENLENLQNEDERLNIDDLHKMDVETNMNNMNINNFDSNTDIINLTTEDVQVIDEMKVVGLSLKNKIKELEWWQDITKNIDKKEVLKELAEYKPELKELIAVQKFDSILTTVVKEDLENLFVNFKPEEDTSFNRFNFIGGVETLEIAMKKFQVNPDMKTYNMLVNLIPNHIESEEELIDRMIKSGNTPDICFTNMLILRRIKRKDTEDNIKKAQSLIQKYNLVPDIVTFGCLSKNIKNIEELKNFLHDFENFGFKMNTKIMNTLISNGFKNLNRNYLVFLLDYISSNKIKVDSKIINRINEYMHSIREAIIEIEKKSETSLNEHELKAYKKTKYFYNHFKKYMLEWTKSINLIENEHPYKKFERKGDKLYQSFIKNTSNN